MPSKHKTPLLGWHPTSAEDAAWVRAEAQRQGRGALTRLLDEALALLRAKHSPRPSPVLAAEDEQPERAKRNCKHRNMRGVKGVCPDCNDWVSPATSRTNGGQ